MFVDLSYDEVKYWNAVWRHPAFQYMHAEMNVNVFQRKASSHP